MKDSPPKLPLRFFRWFCRPDIVEDVEGDLLERFDQNKRQVGFGKARRRLTKEVLLLFRPGIIRAPKNKIFQNQRDMFRHNLLVAWRSLRNKKGYTIINVGGLILGMTVALLNGLWVWDELSFNKNFEHYDRIAQVAKRSVDDGERFMGTTMNYPLGLELRTNYRDRFENVVRTSWLQDYILLSEDEKTDVTGLFSDIEAPELFSFDMVSGVRAGLLDPYSIMISSSTAQLLFDKEDVVGEVISINNKTSVTVTGVYEDFPFSSQLHGIAFFAPWQLWLSENKWIEERALTDWSNHFIDVYVEIPEGVGFEAIQSEITNIERDHIADNERLAARKPEINLYPMSDWHLFPFDDRGGTFDRSPIQMVTLVGTIGLFVLLLACINFINLSTARSEKRAMEVGIRKTLGSARGPLIIQFLSESLVIVTLAFIFALLVVACAIPYFNNLAGKELSIPWSSGGFWLLGLLFILVTSLLAGSYPALYLSSFRPIAVLKGLKQGSGRQTSLPRQVLVVFQFSISVLLIIGTTIIFQQIKFSKDRPVGYTRDGLLMLEMKSPDLYDKYEVFKSELMKTGVIESMGQSMGKVTEIASGNNGWNWEGKDPNWNESFGTLPVSHDYGKTVGWQFIEGRDFSSAFAGDSLGLVINEAAAKIMNLEQPIGAPVSWTWWRDNEVLNYHILGVINDMVMRSPYEPIEPTMFFIKGLNGRPNWINMKINPQVSTRTALAQIESVLASTIPTATFDYKFADDEYALKFASEERLASLTLLFGLLAVFISCLGLIGLASYIAEQRTKEIGIRKILGASVLNLCKLLSRDFLILVMISSLIAIPVAWYFLHQWLEQYTYHVSLHWWVFVGTALGAVLIAVLTVSVQAARVALKNPTSSLRAE